MSRIKKFGFLFFVIILFSCSENPTESIPFPPIPADLDDGWEVSSLSAVGMNPERMTWLSRGINNGDYGNIHSVLVVRHGKLVFEEYYGTYHVNQRHALASVTKSVVSILIGIAVDQGYIKSIDDPVEDYFPEYEEIFTEDTLKKAITIRHLLSMSSGLEWDEWSYSYNDYRNSHFQMQRSSDWLKFVLELPLIREPGTVFTYNSGGSMLLGGIIKNACEIYADTWANNVLFEPLGIETYQWDKNFDGLPNTGGGLNLRPRDLAKIGYVVLNKGKWGDEQLVSESWINISTGKSINVWPGVNYGFQWWLRELPESEGFTSSDNEIIHGLGYAGQFLFIIPRMDMVVVAHSWNLNEFENAPVSFLYSFILPAVDESTIMAKEN